MLWGIEDRLRQQQAISRDYRHVGVQRRERRLRLGALQADRIVYQ